MLSHTHGEGIASFLDTSKPLRLVASERKGAWKVTTWDKEEDPIGVVPIAAAATGTLAALGAAGGIATVKCAAAPVIGVAASACLLRHFINLVPTEVVYTEEEYARLSHLVLQPLRNGTKMNTWHANMENAAQTLWPTGSEEHVAMRHLGCAAIVRYHTHASVQNFGQGIKKTTLERVETNTANPERQAATPFQPDPAPSTVLPSTPSDNGGNTPDDADVMAGASEDGRTHITDAGIVAVIGQEFDKSLAHNHQPLVGALIGPGQKTPNVYSKTSTNLGAAITERITKKQKGNVMGGTELKRIGRVVSNALGHSLDKGIFSEKRIRDWAAEHFHLEEMASKKWSTQRLRNSVDQLWQKAEVKFKHNADVKYECMAEGKAPRMLIADGDDGQLMALAVIKCFEDLLFEWMEPKSIKHAAKKVAMKRIVKELSKKGAGLVEGDGSAWDTTCGAKIRDAIENPVIRRIMEVLVDYGVVPESWAQEHSKACEAKELKLFFARKSDTLRVTIDAIRRSGHRGTSCLNWWINFVMWVCSVFEAPERFLNPSVRKGKDVTGQQRWWNGVFEGDDSLCALHPKMEKGDALSKKFLSFWHAGGFDMKIVFCDTRATVVGWHIACDDGEITDVMCPELPRAMSNSGVGVSPGTVEAAKQGNMRQIKEVAKASAIARAGDFAGILPTVSNKYLEFARSLGLQEVHDREMSYRVYGEDGHGSTEIETEIIAANLQVTPTEELVTMRTLGYDATAQELDRFVTRVWSLEPEVLLDFEGFKSSLPPSWRC